ncbi:MAG TPA: glycosyltransferase family 9 protein [Candidatus Gastranaerophilales bacterium]|nr:glycosyltransferase family 9 protein [Candidatus Gastranaerophilales bacterium]
MNIVLINLGYIGDVINISPVATALKKAYPESKIIVITSPVSVNIAKCIPGVNDAVGFSRYKEHKGIKIFKFAFDFRKKYKPEMAIVLTENFRAAFLGFLTGANKRLGRNSEGRGWLLTHRIPYTEEEKNLQIPVTDYYLKVLTPLKIDCSDKNLVVNIPEKDKQKMETVLQAQNKENHKLIGLCPATGTDGLVTAIKCWSTEEAASFIRYINQKGDSKVVIVGQDACSDFADKLRKNGEDNFIDLTNKTTVSELAATLKLFDKFISVDSAPMHLAVAVKTPTVCLFFQNNHKKWAPCDKVNNAVLYNFSGLRCNEIIDAFEKLPSKTMREY